MLFSREDVAAAVNAMFEPAWEMVRPVPIIRIDFGNGHVATRTLHGNIASHVCAADGQIIDILPGIYTPGVYTAALQQIALFAASVPRPDADRQVRLRDYHDSKARFLRTSPPRITYPRAIAAAPPRPAAPAPARAPGAAVVERVDVGKRIMEMRVEQIVIQPPAGGPADVVPGARIPAGTNLADWAPLATDTWRNETERRLLIHDRLARTTARPRPVQIKKWLYKEVLHADLSDPYLGLGGALFGDDVFRELEG